MVIFWFGEISSPLVKIKFFFLALFFSLFRCCFFGHLLQDIFFCEKKKQSSHYDVTLSHFWFFLSFSWLDLGHSTASNQLQIFFKDIFFFHENKGSFVVTFLYLAFFSLSANTYWVWNKSSDFFLHHLWKSKILKRIFWSWNMFDTLSTTRKKAHFFQQVPSLKYCKKSRLIWSLEKSKTTFLIWWKNHQKTFLFTQKESNILWWFCFCGSCQMIKLHFCFWRKCSFR